jgi:hypothetical protein
MHLRWGDGLGGPSSHRNYRDGDRRITTDRVRLAMLSRSRPHWLDEALSADRVHRHRHVADGIAVEASELAITGVA